MVDEFKFDANDQQRFKEEIQAFSDRLLLDDLAIIKSELDAASQQEIDFTLGNEEIMFAKILLAAKQKLLNAALLGEHEIGENILQRARLAEIKKVVDEVCQILKTKIEKLKLDSTSNQAKIACFEESRESFVRISVNIHLKTFDPQKFIKQDDTDSVIASISAAEKEMTKRLNDYQDEKSFLGWLRQKIGDAIKKILLGKNYESGELSVPGTLFHAGKKIHTAVTNPKNVDKFKHNKKPTLLSRAQ
jgi:hypothetical protein